MRVRTVLAIGLLVVTSGCQGDAFGTRPSSSPTGDDTTTSSSADTSTSEPAPTTAPTTAATTTPSTQPTTPQATTTSTAPLSPTMELIETSGEVRVGTYADSRLPWADPVSGVGFEVDLAREIADRLFDDVTVRLVPLTAPERFVALEEGTIEMLVRGTAHTTSREESMDFTVPYLLDGIVVVVGDTSGFAAVDDLDGSIIAVPRGTTLELEVDRLLRQANVSADLELVETTDDMRALFAAGAVDGYATDWIVAMTVLDSVPGLRAIWLGASDPIAIAARPDDPEFVASLDEILRELIADGTWTDLAARWLPAPVPWTTEELLARPPSDR